MSFLQRIQHFITTQKLFAADARLLVAVSGGLDSVALSHVGVRLGWDIGLAHCNFQLRGPDSDADAKFVQALAQELGLPFYQTTFETLAFAETQQMSIQMAARALRYDWLESTRQAQGYDWIVTAHHRNDSIETFFYNFAKGAGLRGLQGIPVRNGRVVRPLLPIDKNDILDWARAENLRWREDASNAEDKYARNKIRHHIMPVLQELNPDFEQTATDNLQRLREALALYELGLEQARAQAVVETDAQLRIDLSKLSHYQNITNTLLYEWLHPYGFHARQIARMPTAATGAIFYASAHRLLVDRAHLILEKQAPAALQQRATIPAGTSELHLDVGCFTFSYQTECPETFPDDSFSVYLNAEKLRFPLTLRHWQAGDYFYPLGLSGKRQKLQDFFTNLKLSRFEKERVWLLCTADGAICWVVGHRLDERYKITADTKTCWVIHFQKS